MSSNNRIKLSVVIPVYNSEKTIELLVKRLIEDLASIYDLEIVLVNDDSKDQSEEVCIALHTTFKPIVKFYSLSKNVGEHNAVMAGLNQTKGDYAVIMDDDFQNPVSEIIKMVNYICEHDVDVVYTYYEKKQHSFFRNLGSNFNNRVANIMLKKPKDLYLSSFKLMNRYLITEILRYDLPFPYIDGLILRATSKIGKVKALHEKRKVGHSNYTLKKLIHLWMNMFTNFSILPLRFSVIMGFIFAAVGLILGIYSVIEKILDPSLPMGYTSMVVAVSVFAGIQLMAIGMLGEYLGRMFLSQNKQPQYSIRKRFD